MIEFQARNIRIEFDQSYAHNYPFKIRATIYTPKDEIGYTSGIFDEVRIACSDRETLVIGHAKICFGPAEFACGGFVLTQEIQMIGHRINIVQTSTL